MPSYKEMQRIAHDPARVRTLARRLLVTDQDWTEWELDFLESLAAHMGPDALTTRQREKLVELRDDAELISTFNGFNIGSLIEQCWLARQDLSDEDNIEFLEELKGTKTLKRRQVGRLLRCCRELGVIED